MTPNPNHYGWPFFSWESLFGVGIILLGLVIAYAMWRNKTRNRANDRITQEATRQLYNDGDAYQREGRDTLEQQLKP